MLFRYLEDKILSIFSARIKIFFAVISMLVFILLGRIFYLQVVKYDEYIKISDNNRVRTLRVKADRGFIYDRNGTLLVKNVPSYNLYLVKEDAEDVEELLNNLSSVIDIDPDATRTKLKKAYFYEPVLVYRGLTFEQVGYLSENIETYPGIKIDLDPVRQYPYNISASHILGYLGEISENELKTKSGYQGGDLIGKTGVENYYEDILRGADGKQYVEVDSLGQVIRVIDYKKAVPGKDIKLTIDIRLQDFAKNFFGRKKGSVVVEDIDTGEILLMFSSPSYDLDNFVPFVGEDYWKALLNDKSKPLMNRAIEGSYPPGSVFKILMAYAGLTEKLINAETTFDCNGALQYGDFSYRCWKNGGHGEVSLKRAISESCDVYFYNLGLILGIDTISRYAGYFSLGNRTGIDLPNEKKGVFPSRQWKNKFFGQIWFPGETIIASIGQGYISITPLQLVNMLSGIFNVEGSVPAPRVLHSLLEKKQEYSVDSKIINILPVNDKVRGYLIEGMKEAVYGKSGTSYRARVENVTVAGKTGTAQVVSLKKTEDYDDDKIPEKYRDHSWFGAIFPAEKPKYALVAMIENGGSGSQSAAAFAGAVINKMLDLGYVSNR